MQDRSQKEPAKKTAAGSDERRRTGMRSVAAPISRVARPALKRRGLAGGRIVAEWPTIVGAMLAACSCPERLSQPRNGGPGTLKIRVDGPLAIELQHLEPVIIERINGYFGYRAVERLSMVRGPLPSRTDAAAAVEPEPVADRAVAAQAAQNAAGIEDEALREALESLGRHVLARTKRAMAR